MKTVQNQGAQGDVLFRRVESLPPALREILPEKDGHVVAHSETGHHHVVEAGVARRFVPVDDTGPLRGLVSYLEVLKDHADVIHLRSFDTHETLRLPAGLWEIRRQREWSPEGWRRVED